MIFLWFLLLLFAGATLVQVLAWLLLYPQLLRNSTFEIRNSKFSADVPARSSALPVSVIICARNEATQLAQNLPVVLQQHYPDYEVVVVDDASTDATPEVLAGLQMRFPQLRTVRVNTKKHPGKKQALALGLAVARHEHLAFTDADCRPASCQWLALLMEGFASSPKVDIVLGIAPFRPRPGLLAGWARFETLFTALQYGALARAGLPYMGVGRNLAWTRAVYGRAGGFDAHLELTSGDDDLLINAAARPGQVALCPDPAAFMYSEAPPTWQIWWRQKRRHLSAGMVYRPLHRLVLGVLALSHTLHYGLGCILLVAQFGTVPVLLGYVVRLLPALALYRRLLPRWRAADLLLLLPFYDGLLAIYYGAFVPWGLWGKSPVTWKG